MDKHFIPDIEIPEPIKYLDDYATSFKSDRANHASTLDLANVDVKLNVAVELQRGRGQIKLYISYFLLHARL